MEAERRRAPAEQVIVIAGSELMAVSDRLRTQAAHDSLTRPSYLVASKMNGIQEELVSTRLRFAASLVTFFVVFLLLYAGAKWNSDIQLGVVLIHDFVFVSLCALRLRYLRMNQAWALLAFLPAFNVLIAIFLLAKGQRSAERYSGA